MTGLVTIVPSRGRPAAADEMVTAFRQTCEAPTLLVLAVDRDDPNLDAYVELLARNDEPPGLLRVEVEVYIADAPSTMVRTLNLAARQYAPRAQAVAFMGDDHRPRTRGWDVAYLDALREMRTGLVYGNDLLQGENLPTHVAMTSDIVQTLGYMAPPPLTHLFVDNYWLTLGKGAGRIKYLPDVVVEHVHPFAGKAAMDDGYSRVNAASMYAADGAAYTDFNPRLLADIRKVKNL